MTFCKPKIKIGTLPNIQWYIYSYSHIGSVLVNIGVPLFAGSSSMSSTLPWNSTSSIKCHSSSWKATTQSISYWRRAATLCGLTFLAQFCRQLRIRSSCKLLNAADWTFYASKIKTTLLAYPSFKDIFCRRAGIIVWNTFWKFLFRFFRKKIGTKSEILEQWQILGFFVILCPFDTIIIRVVNYWHRRWQEAISYQF